MEETILKAQPRTQVGSRSAKRLREQGLLPANIYGHQQENLLVTLDAKAFKKAFGDGHRLLDIRIGNTVERSLIKEVQYDPFGSEILHVDFTRVSLNEPIEVEVPIETIGVPKGVSSGGVLSFQVQELLVKGLPDDVPERYELKVESLEEGQFLRLKDLTPPPNCEVLGDPEQVIVGVMQKRVEAEEVAEEEAEAGQPEVIGRKKEEAESGEAEGS